MTNMAVADDMEEMRAEPLPKAGSRRKPTPIVPQRNVAGTALAIVIGIMTFLSCLTLGAVSLVRDSASRLVLSD